MLDHLEGLVVIHVVELTLQLVALVQQRLKFLGSRDLVVLLELQELFHLFGLYLQLQNRLLGLTQRSIDYLQLAFQ